MKRYTLCRGLKITQIIQASAFSNQLLWPCVNPNLTRPGSSVYETRMLQVLNPSVFCSVFQEITKRPAFITDIRVGETQRPDANKHRQIPVPALKLLHRWSLLLFFSPVNLIYERFFQSGNTLSPPRDESRVMGEKCSLKTSLSLSTL